MQGGRKAMLAPTLRQSRKGGNVHSRRLPDRYPVQNGYGTHSQRFRRIPACRTDVRAASVQAEPDLPREGSSSTRLATG